MLRPAGLFKQDLACFFIGFQYTRFKVFFKKKLRGAGSAA
jgi:hypothetical protein